MNVKRIALGSDHAGYSLKELLKEHCRNRGIDTVDVGTFSEDPVDYPDIAQNITGVMLTENIPGVFLGGSGFGECMAGNKVTGIRASRCTNVDDAVITRRHNDANMLNLGARMIDAETAKNVLDAFLSTKFDGESDSGQDGERHVRRLRKMEGI